MDKEYAIGQEVDGCVVTEITDLRKHDCSKVCKYKDKPTSYCLDMRCVPTRRTDRKWIIFKPITKQQEEQK